MSIESNHKWQMNLEAEEAVEDCNVILHILKEHTGTWSNYRMLKALMVLIYTLAKEVTGHEETMECNKDLDLSISKSIEKYGTMTLPSLCVCLITIVCTLSNLRLGRKSS